MLPIDADRGLANRSVLWNQVEAAEKRGDAQVAREVQLSLPHELSFEQRRELVRDFVQTAFVDRGMVADIAMHTPDKHGDDRNFHAHILLTTRHADGINFAGKAREWNSRETLADWRRSWAETQNRHLAQVLGQQAPKVSHKSLEDQGLEREATIHLGPTASAIERNGERNGERSERGEINRAVKASNADRAELAKSITAMDDQLAKMLPQRETGIESIKKELADYDASLRRQVAGWKVEQKALAIPQLVKPSDVRREVISPARARLHDAQREHERTKERTKAMAAKRTTLASFLRNPQRAIWAKIAEVHAMDRARRELARARAGVKVREDWLRSEPGRSHILGRVDQATKAAQPAKQQSRNLDRKIRRVEKRIKTVGAVRERVEIAEQLGLRSVQRPISARDATQVLRRVDAATQQVFSRATTQQLQQARETVRSLARGIGMGFSR